MPKEIEIKSVSDLLRPEVQAIIAKAEIKAKGTFTPPSLDLQAIKARADKLDAASQTKADMFMLLLEIEELTNESH
jgi:hypothetical protein